MLINNNVNYEINNFDMQSLKNIQIFNMSRIMSRIT